MNAYLITFYGLNPKWSTITKIQLTSVKVWTLSRYFHTELIIGNIRVTSHTKKGVTIHEVHDFNHDKYLNKIKDRAIITKVKVQEKLIQKAIDYAWSQENKPYDWKGIFLSQVVPLGYENPDKWFCNEIVGEVLIEAGAEGIIKKPNLYNPGTFINLFAKA